MHADRRQPTRQPQQARRASGPARATAHERTVLHGLHRNFLSNTQCVVGRHRRGRAASRSAGRGRGLPFRSAHDHLAPWPGAYACLGARRRRTGRARPFRSGSLTLISAGTRLGWCRNSGDRSTDGRAGPDNSSRLWPIVRHAAAHVEFHNLMAFEDPAITYILRAMQAELRQGCARADSTTRLWRPPSSVICSGTIRCCR